MLKPCTAVGKHLTVECTGHCRHAFGIDRVMKHDHEIHYQVAILFCFCDKGDRLVCNAGDKPVLYRDDILVLVVYGGITESAVAYNLLSLIALGACSA